MILHLEYRPDEIPRKSVRDLLTYGQNAVVSNSQTVLKMVNFGIKQTVLNYSRPQHLSNVSPKVKLYQFPGKEM